MNLYLLRHSNAEDQPPRGQSGDRWRRLTSGGRVKARDIGRALRRLDLGLDLVLTSPAPRALETAQAVVEELDPKPPLERLEALWIGGDPGELVSRLRGIRSSDASVLLVGHEPDLGRLVSRWLTGGSGLRVDFKKGGLCRLSVARVTSGRCAILEWFLTPRHLRWIGAASSEKAR